MSRPDPLTRRDFFKALAASALAAGGAAVLPVGFPKGPELGMIATDSAAAPDIMIYFRYWFEPDGVPKFEQVSKEDAAEIRALPATGREDPHGQAEA